MNGHNIQEHPEENKGFHQQMMQFSSTLNEIMVIGDT